MTILTSPTVVGVDVAKAEIVVYREDLETIQAVVNDRQTLGRWLKMLPAQSSIALPHLDLLCVCDCSVVIPALGHVAFDRRGMRAIP